MLILYIFDVFSGVKEVEAARSCRKNEYSDPCGLTSKKTELHSEKGKVR